jgi:hypothetical protein
MGKCHPHEGGLEVPFIAASAPGDGGDADKSVAIEVGDEPEMTRGLEGLGIER